VESVLHEGADTTWDEWRSGRPGGDIGLQTDQCQTVRDRGQFAACLDRLIAEPVGEDAPDARDQRGAAGQKDPVDLPSRDRGRFERLVNGQLDAGDIVGDPRLEIMPGDLGPDRQAAAVEGEDRRFFHRKRARLARPTAS
jgi:hypothetical protein